MANISLNGTAYSGTPVSPGTPWKPISIDVKTIKPGVSLVAETGARTFVLFGAVKYEWTITWEKVPENTRAALAGLAATLTTFTFIDPFTQSYTVQMEDGDHQQKTAFTDSANVQYYDITITIRQV